MEFVWKIMKPSRDHVARILQHNCRKYLLAGLRSLKHDALDCHTFAVVANKLPRTAQGPSGL